MNNDAFLYLAGHHIPPVTVKPSDALAGRNYRIDLGDASVSLGADNANALVVAFAELMYDNNEMTMETAERMQYLASSVLADQEKCPNCGGNGATGPDYDPDPCNACRGTGWKA